MAEKIKKYHTHTLDTYGEKGFTTDICCLMKGIIIIHQLCRGKSFSSNHDASHELISLLICTDKSLKDIQSAFYTLNPSKILNIFHKWASLIQSDSETVITSESLHRIYYTIRVSSREEKFEIID